MVGAAAELTMVLKQPLQQVVIGSLFFIGFIDRVIIQILKSMYRTHLRDQAVLAELIIRSKVTQKPVFIGFVARNAKGFCQAQGRTQLHLTSALINTKINGKSVYDAKTSQFNVSESGFYQLAAGGIIKPKNQLANFVFPFL